MTPRTSPTKPSTVSPSRRLEIFDDLHSDDEERFIAIGPVRRGVVLVVWTEVVEETTRSISARWATKRERAAYEAFVKEQR
jgi:uncharacterized protein